MTEILKAEKLSFAYNTAKPLLHELDLTVNRGDFLGLIGPNGAGKTTIFRLLSGFLKPHSGSVSLHGKDIRVISHRERAKIMAVVPQFITSPMPFTVRQVVEMGRTSRLSNIMPLSVEDRQAVQQALDEMDLVNLAENYFNQLSGGERQRTMIAAALAQEPEILLLDEPTAALDLGHTVKLMAILNSLRQRGITVMTISHDIELMARYCRQLILLRNGTILASGTPNEIITPEQIENAYGCKVEIVNGPQGEPLLSHPRI
jgi:iron complex transport system ATP-binding protein